MDKVIEMLRITSPVSDLLQRVAKAGPGDDLHGLPGKGARDGADKFKVLRQLKLYTLKALLRTTRSIVGDLQYLITSALQLIGYGYGHIDEDCKIWVLHGYPSPVL